MPTVEDVGKFIRDRREELGYSREELGRRAGVSKQSIANWEDGRHAIGGRYLPRLMQALRLKDPAPLCVEDGDSTGLAASGMLRQPPSPPDPSAREVLYEFLDSEDAAGMEPPLSPREIAWLMDHHVDGNITPRYFMYAILAERERSRSPRPPSDRPNEAAGAAERSGLKRRDAISQRKPAKRS